MAKKAITSKRRRERLAWSHVLKAMRAGDTIYMPEEIARDRGIVAVVGRYGGKCTTSIFVAFRLKSKNIDARRIVSVSMIEPMQQRIY